MYAFAINPKRTYYKSVAKTKSVENVNVLSWYTHDFGREMEFTSIKVTYCSATYTHTVTDGEDSYEETVTYSPKVYVEISSDKSTWVRVGEVTQGNTLTINLLGRYLRVQDYDTSDDSCVNSHTIAYVQTDLATSSDYTHYVDKCDACVAKIGNDYYEVEVK